MKIVRKVLKLGGLAALSVAATFPQMVLAQPQLEEIVVTAERRETSLQDTPSAIAAVTGDFLESTNMNNLREFTLTTPGISMSGTSSTQQIVTVRGNSTSSGGEPAVAQSIGFFVDGIYLGKTVLFDQSLSDVERVEILRGPQGTLWGHNIVGGSINVITKDPTETPEAEAKVTIGNYGRFEASGRIAGPLTDELLGQLSYSTEGSDGFIRDLDSGDYTRGDDVQALRGKLLWQAGPRFDSELSFTYSRNRSGNQLGVYFPGPDDPVTGFEYPDDIEHTTFNRGLNGGQDIDTLLGILDLNYELENGWTLSSLTGYVDLDGGVSDWGFFPFPESFGTFTNDLVFVEESFSQEFRLASREDSRLFWQAGAYYYNNKADYDVAGEQMGLPGTLNFLGSAPADLNGDGLATVGRRQTSDTESFALFGQATFALTDWMNITGGIRYTDVEKEAVTFGRGEPVGRLLDSSVCEPGALTCPFTQGVSDSWDNVSPKVTVDVHWDNLGAFDSLMAYTTYSEGWKEGGFNPGTSPADVLGEATRVQPEEAENREIGLKTTFWDGRARFNLAYFETDYVGQQAAVQLGPGNFGVVNTDSDIEGWEIDGAVGVTDWLDLTYGLALYDSEYAEDAALPGDPPTPIGGNPTLNTPDTSYSLGWDARWPLADGKEVFFNGSYSYKGEAEHDPAAPLAAAEPPGVPVCWN